MLASTYLGGFASEYYYTTLRPATALAIDSDGDIYVAGETGSHDFPITDGAYDTSNGGYNDAFISKFDANLSSNKCKINGHVLGNKGNPIEYSKIKLKGTNVLKRRFPMKMGYLSLDLNAGTYVIMATKEGL